MGHRLFAGSFALWFGAVSLHAQSVDQTHYGNVEGAFFGVSVNGAGDVNGDGVEDLVVGGNATNGTQRGTVDVYCGVTGSSLRHWERPDWLGYSVDGAGDFDGDGFDDIIAGAFFSSFHIYSGQTGDVLFEVSDPGSRVGFSVAGLGDVNGDGYDDVAVGAPLSDLRDGSRPGNVRVYAGPDGTLLETWWGESHNDQFGWSVESAGDQDGDLRNDVVVGVPFRSPVPRLQGEVHVYSTSTGALLHLWRGGADSLFGTDVAGGADLNLDGSPDILIGAPNNNVNGEERGSVLAFSGADQSLLHRWDGNLEGAEFGRTLASPGDIDGDGFADVVIGEPFATGLSAGTPYRGSVWVMSGATGQAFRTIRGSDHEDEVLGWAVGPAGDVNQDGYRDFLVSDPGYHHPEDSAGAVWLYSGRPCVAAFENYGNATEGTLGAPTLTLNGIPELCANVDLLASNTRGVNTRGLLLIGNAADSWSGIAGTILVAQPWVVLPVSLSESGFQRTLNVPCNTDLCDLELFLQMLQVDPGGVAGLAMSPGLKLILGFSPSD